MRAVVTRSSQVPVLGSTMHVVESGVGDPVVFLHGNPTSSVLWRQVVGPVAAAGHRCLAVDLIGMGRSGRPGCAYRFDDHETYLGALLDVLDLTPAPVLVGHDWGGVLALRRAARSPEEVRAVALCESHIHPIESWADLGDGAEMFRRLRAEGTGEQLVLQESFFVEKALPAGMLRLLSEAELDDYRAPYPDPASRRPILAWVREIPIEGSPVDMVEVVLANQAVIADPDLPVLLLYADPGAVIGPTEVAWCREHGRSLSAVDVGAGLHFLPEDRPQEIAAALIEWLGELPDPG